VISVPQDLQNRTYYYNKVPFEGKIDTSWSATKIYDFVRAMSFAPFHNPLSPAMINFDNSTLVVKKAKIIGNTLELSSKQGEVIDIGNEGVVMQTGNGLLLLTLSDRSMPLADTAKVCIAKGITKGTILGSL
jgi:methionyl-tRNA formyltransferase